MTTETKPEPVKLCEADSPEWLELRTCGLGASESAAICGCDPYKQPLEVWYDKLIHHLHRDDRAEPKEIAGELGISENYVKTVLDPPDAGDDAWFGTNIEPVIAKFFERQTGRRVLESPVGLYRHHSLDWMRATPDAIVEPSGDGREGGEWKSLDPHYARVLGIHRDSEELPADATKYYLQAFWQMEVCGFSSVHFGILIGRRLVPFEVKRDERIIKAITTRGRELWERVINREPPPVDFAHRGALSLQKVLYDSVGDTRIQMDEAMEEIAVRLRELRAEIKERESEKNKLNAEMLNFIGNHAAAVMSDGKEIRKIAIGEAEISYTRKPSIQLRECNAKSAGLVLSDPTDEKVDLEDRFRRVDFRLQQAGFKRYEQHRGSWYYIAADGPERIRVSDHEANQNTQERIDRGDMVSLRVDMDGWDAKLEYLMS